MQLADGSLAPPCPVTRYSMWLEVVPGGIVKGMSATVALASPPSVEAPPASGPGTPSPAVTLP